MVGAERARKKFYRGDAEDADKANTEKSPESE
jgi:hypothetical protein